MAKSSKPQSLTDIVIDALEDIKAKDIRVLDVAGITSVSDFIALATAEKHQYAEAAQLRQIMQELRGDVAE